MKKIAFFFAKKLATSRRKMKKLFGLEARSFWKAATSRKSVIKRRGSRMRARRQFRSCLVTTRKRRKMKEVVAGAEKNLNESDSSRRSGGQPGIQRCHAASFALCHSSIV